MPPFNPSGIENMCQKCVDAVKKYFPSLRKKDYGELLMSATAFPFGSPAYIEGQLKKLSHKSDGSLLGAIGYAHEQLDKQMAKRRRK